jgi:hypothetical protein
VHVFVCVGASSCYSRGLLSRGPPVHLCACVRPLGESASVFRQVEVVPDALAVIADKKNMAFSVRPHPYKEGWERDGQTHTYRMRE